jgi:hypothetical protein
MRMDLQTFLAVVDIVGVLLDVVRVIAAIALLIA